MNKNNKLTKLRENLALHQAASNRTSDLVLSEGGYNPSSPSAQLVNQKHADKAKATSRTAYNQAHSKPATSNHLKPLPHAPSLRQLTAQAQAATMKPKK